MAVISATLSMNFSPATTLGFFPPGGRADENGVFFSVGSEETEYMMTLITQYGAQLEAET